MTPDKVEAALGVLSAIVDKTNWRPDIEAGTEALSVLTEALAERGWRPIESAPDDEIVLVADHLGDIFTAHKQFGYWYAWIDFVGHDLRIDGPTHWQPLPEPPHDR